jgi:hypothetical protein
MTASHPTKQQQKFVAAQHFFKPSLNAPHPLEFTVLQGDQYGMHR